MSDSLRSKMHIMTVKNWMQCTVSHVAIQMDLLNSVPNGLRTNLRESNVQKLPRGACPQTPIVLHAYACSPHLQVTPVQVIWPDIG